jgi:hypothetical protein
LLLLLLLLLLLPLQTLLERRIFPASAQNASLDRVQLLYQLFLQVGERPLVGYLYVCQHNR